MAGSYRALLIGNSTYPADEHNLQTLKGPVKDIAVLNRALVDADAGLFADVDVTLLPETTSARAIRALGRFFGTADRDDVLLVYFSGHGKLDRGGRLHLCMQDTDTTDLLSTSVSSARINEFADASRARNMVIVLDCCYAGAFRGGDFGDAVAGPGRYVLTSCRGTQLANDATVDNGTSVFTQHLVDGLVTAAADHDGDGYVTFSDLYAYVDGRLRASGKQIPQRRVDGDGDLRLARRSSAAAPVAPPPSRPSAGKAPRRLLTRRNAVIAAAVALVSGVAGVVLGLGGSHSGASGGGDGTSYVASGPWRIRITNESDAASGGCAVALTETGSGDRVTLPTGLYGEQTYHVHQAGTFRWTRNDPNCSVTPLAGAGSTTLPLFIESLGETDAFTAPAKVSFHVTDDKGSPDCHFRLFDPADGKLLDAATSTVGAADAVLDPGGVRTVYLGSTECAVRVSAG